MALLWFNMSENKIIEELVKIRELLEPKTATQELEKKGFWVEFMDFIKKYGVVGLAIGFIIGSASKNLVNTLVGDLLMPVITYFISGGGWKETTLSWGSIVFSVGRARL